MLWLRFLLVCLLASLCALSRGISVISNTLPRRDASGALMDLHDGAIHHINGTYYYWGMQYGLCNITKSGCDGLWYPPHCGYRTNHNVSLYSSPDLVTWNFVLDALPMESRPLRVYYRPQVVFNPRTNLYVLWINMVNFWPGTQDPNYGDATYLVATTPSPHLPFSVVGSAAVKFGALGVGDLSLFVDPLDGEGYIAYGAWAASVHAVSVEKLSFDYLSSTNASSGVITPPFYEAPLLFHRSSSYYLTTGPTCCFCAEGAPSLVYTAPSPLGPWTNTQTYIDTPLAANNGSLLHAQNSMLVDVTLANGTRAILWAGDRWASAIDGIFGHNLQYWGQLAWDDSAVPPRVAPLQWQDSLELDLMTEIA